MVDELRAEQGIPGLAIAVSVDNRIVWSEGFGFSDLEHSVPVTPQTRFRIGSVSKLFTATAAARLFEQGLLDLDAAVQKYAPFFPEKEHRITPRQLLGHLAGIRHYKRNEYINQKRFENISESLKVFLNDPLLHQPGSKYAYSSYGYVLLGQVIEGSAKRDFPTVVQDLVFEPLRMNDTVVDDNRRIIKNRSGFYSYDSEKKQTSNEIFVDYSDRIAAGGFLSTPEDLVSFGSKTAFGDFFKPETRSLVFTSLETLDGTETGVGLGWRIGKDAKGRTIYFHGGDSVGGRSILVVYPESWVAVAILCNLTFARISENDAARFADLFIR
ncbi:MAG: beta-lactamase family protein [Aridibacter famidurans]|nr:beta-lactamase family protein [Aridibacter famidurans]